MMRQNQLVSRHCFTYNSKSQISYVKLIDFVTYAPVSFSVCDTREFSTISALPSDEPLDSSAAIEAALDFWGIQRRWLPGALRAGLWER